MAKRTQHFANFRYLPSREEVYNPPGVVGDVIVSLSKGLVQFEEFGIADADDGTRLDILDGKGDPTRLFPVETSRNGTIENCRKLDAQVDPVAVPQANGDKFVSYRIMWKQVAP